MISIHCCESITWQPPFAAKMSAGLKALGLKHNITGNQSRESDVAILLGTSMWRSIERDGDYLLVDRCSFGDTNKFVSLVWNGHGRRGDHKTPTRPGPSRLEKLMHANVLTMEPWKGGGSKIVLAGQYESYSPTWRTMGDWYRSHPEATHFRAHPAQPIEPTLLPPWRSFDDVREFITLNSSVAVEAILRGIPTTVDDEGGMAWPGFRCHDERIPWLRWLAWTQWSHDEIAEGLPIKHLFK